MKTRRPYCAGGEALPTDSGGLTVRSQGAAGTRRHDFGAHAEHAPVTHGRRNHVGPARPPLVRPPSAPPPRRWPSPAAHGRELGGPRHGNQRTEDNGRRTETRQLPLSAVGCPLSAEAGYVARHSQKKTVGEERDGAGRVELSEAGGRGSADSPRGRRETRSGIPRRRIAPRTADEAAGSGRNDERERDRHAPSSTKVRRDELDQNVPCAAPFAAASQADCARARRIRQDFAPSLT